MKSDDILNQLNNPGFRINTTKLLYEILTTTRRNNYHLQAILKRQLEIKELLQGNTAQEVESNVESKLNELASKFSDYLKEDMIDDVEFLSSDD